MFLFIPLIFSCRQVGAGKKATLDKIVMTMNYKIQMAEMQSGGGQQQA